MLSRIKVFRRSLLLRKPLGDPEKADDGVTEYT